MPRKDRTNNSLRSINIIPHFAPHATGSVLIECGNTRVICAATLEEKIPSWMIKQNDTGNGWLTAEYSMLPYSTLERKQRDSSRGKPDGRTVEIQRLIGRALRAVTNLTLLKGYTLWIDCDVLQADGGTRTASINGAYVAAQLAVRKLLKDGKLTVNPFVGRVGAISVGIVGGEVVLDLDYAEDSCAEVDFNVIMNDKDAFIEIQGTAERKAFPKSTLDAMLELAKKGIQEISLKQLEILR